MVRQFMWDGRMENILKDEAVKYSEVVREFTEADVLAVYESECRDMDNDMKVRALFDAAVEACGKWLRQVVTADIFDHTKHNTARVSLIVPDGSIYCIHRLERWIISSDLPYAQFPIIQ